MSPLKILSHELTLMWVRELVQSLFVSPESPSLTNFFLNFIYLYFLIFGCIGCWLLRVGFL